MATSQVPEFLSVNNARASPRSAYKHALLGMRMPQDGLLASSQRIESGSHRPLAAVPPRWALLR